MVGFALNLLNNVDNITTMTLVNMDTISKGGHKDH